MFFFFGGGGVGVGGAGGSGLVWGLWVLFFGGSGLV